VKSNNNISMEKKVTGKLNKNNQQREYGDRARKRSNRETETEIKGGETEFEEEQRRRKEN
jgi:hypothetical protein